MQDLIKQEHKIDGVKELPQGWENGYLDMVALATICDMVPLVGENRLFTFYGLKVLRKSPRFRL